MNEFVSFIEDDLFNRESLAINITKLIEADFFVEPERNSFVICVNSPWGTGKTTFLEKWIQMIDSQNNFEQTDKSKKLNTIYYNVWENDDYHDPAVPIFFEIFNEYIDKVEDFFDNLTSNIASATTKGVLTAISKKTVIGEVLQDLTKSNLKEVFKSYSSHSDLKEKFFDILTKSNTKSKCSKTIIFIDDLDRCRPNYAIETLERIKHFFDIENLVFVVACDIEQLAHSVSALYGSGMDSEGYLNKFFDIKINIPKYEIKKYLSLILKKQAESGLLDSNNHNSLILNLSEYSFILEKCGFSLRDINLSVRKLMYLYHNKKNEFKKDIENLYSENEWYAKINKNKISKLSIYYIFIILSINYKGMLEEVIFNKNRFIGSDSIKELIISHKDKVELLYSLFKILFGSYSKIDDIIKENDNQAKLKFYRQLVIDDSQIDELNSVKKYIVLTLSFMDFIS